MAQILAGRKGSLSAPVGEPEYQNIRNGFKEQTSPPAEETEQARIERLGRERPPQFTSLMAEIFFVYSILASQFMAEYFVSGFNVILPILIHDLSIPRASVVWPAGAFALVTAAFLLPFGRFADMYGGYPIYLLGLAWFFIWSLIAGFSTNELMLDFSRALQGLGPAAFLPSGVMLMGNIYRPGPRKNRVFSLYGGSAPLGFFFGVFIAGLTGEFLGFGWYFWIGTILVFTTVIAAYFTVPSDVEAHRKSRIEMDWLGSALIVCGLLLTVFAMTDSSGAPQGWQTPYIPVTLILGVVLLALAIFVEGWVATNPLIPFELFRVPYLGSLFIALFFSYGNLGIFLLYATLYMQDIFHTSPLLITAWYIPMSLGGILIAVTGGYVLHLLEGTWLMLLAGCGWVVTAVLFAVAPEGANYWAYIFPAMICATIGIDVLFNVANIFITTNLSSSRQGLAGALVNSLLYLGIAFLIAGADVVQTQTSAAGKGLRASYQAVFWFQFACAVLSLGIMIFFVRIRRAESEMTVDEKAAQEHERKQMEGGREVKGEKGGEGGDERISPVRDEPQDVGRRNEE